MAKIAYQLYSARWEAEKDFPALIRDVAALGYEGVEFAGFFGKSAEQIAALLSENALEAVSSHVPFQAIEKDMFGVIGYHLAIGCRWIAVPFLEEAERPGRPGFARVIRVLHRFARLCREAGIGLLYHNHEFEFDRLSGMYALDFLYEAVPAELLAAEIDTCWVHYSGIDPAAYIEKYAGRCPVVHLKDYVCPDRALSPRPASFEFRPLGRGCQDVAAICRAAVLSGAQWLVVEQDAPMTSPLADARISLETLRAIKGA